LKGILQSLEPFARPNLAAKVFKHMEYSDEIMQCKETLDYCFKKFLVCHTMMKSCKDIDTDLIRFTTPSHYDLAIITHIKVNNR